MEVQIIIEADLFQMVLWSIYCALMDVGCLNGLPFILERYFILALIPQPCISILTKSGVILNPIQPMFLSVTLQLFHCNIGWRTHACIYIYIYI